jgi:hypothetical protein
MAEINTTKGPVEESTLARTVGFEDRPTEFVVWVEWRLTDGPRDERGLAELVRRDAHVILKQPSVTADAIAGGL